MHPKEALLKLLKSLGVDIRQALVGIILGSLVVAYGGLLLLSKAVLNYSILLLTTPIPLWPAILLVVLGCSYVYFSLRRKMKKDCYDELDHMGKSYSESLRKLKKAEVDCAALQQQSAEFERLATERKFLLDVAEKKIAELSKPIEAASASSAPGPDDYHAPRRSFFPGNRPKRT